MVRGTLRSGARGETYTEKAQKQRKGIMVAQLVKNLPVMWDTWVQFLGWEDPLEKGMAAHSSIQPGEFHGLCNLPGSSVQGVL